MATAPLEGLERIGEVEGLLSEGQALQERLGELGQALRQTAEQLEQGHPPSPATAAMLIEAAKDFEGWLERVQRLLPGPLEPHLPSTLEALRAHRQALEEAALQQKALGVLEQVSSLAYRGTEEFLPLSAVQFDALGLMREFKEATGLSDTVRALAEGTHPYNLLLRLVTDSEMSNEEWVNAYQKVGQELGQELAVAAVRGRLYLPE
ncbi:hypothetical protein Mlute_01302 [Meiothermus luteus]|jgi:hypothetical protein|uniref:Uncharacterized protein n=1 Tax=Meiothermus luteus TaxID=2026184 RepID=A0A399ES60_9DEIN|nr:hypothetical protein [Meiothermus luteus]RIH86356.1 hypothetical protein Mlute_01302 [Meiothermus luteus]RMH56398.1 MAG: hypothetical protein D6684_05425 [Deinococcota bacterium]